MLGRFLLGAIVIQGALVAAPVIDGKIEAAEWSAARKDDLVGGGTVSVLQRNGFVYVAVHGTRAGLASLCAAKSDTVRILHASAATGEAQFVRSDGQWKQTARFDWRLRDSPRAGGVTPAQYDEMVRTIGWTANPSAAGSPDREFQIRADDFEAFAVTYLTTDEPMTLAYWPATISDDCRNNMTIAQGFLPAAASFDPSGWYRIRPAAR